MTVWIKRITPVPDKGLVWVTLHMRGDGAGQEQSDKYPLLFSQFSEFGLQVGEIDEQLADKMAKKAIKSHRSLKLDPMNPYERKVIHATLQSNPRVTTRSEGQDPYRRVVIEPKH